ncbi:hypothetical protein [Kribbella albertanoniae]|uniref:Glycosyl hydrolase family 98 putative carbohydrate-binding module domain-containing protein n=1 Tax=Kribbella albertanoniae TaxID=1266829 RepID=A0A4R4Q9W1_9ACTN|nr:hypothetical protein [Kribbella albertanoniae]TDC32088.1 hypothetical protein E1261_09280 [Kribbella albertanoniae]
MAGALLSAAGCGGAAEGGGQPAATVTVTETVQASAPAPSATSSTPVVVDDPTEPTDSATPVALAADVAGRPLVLGNIFKYPDGWKDGRYDVADRKQSTGIGGILSGCGYEQTLELRLANNFGRLKLEFGQSNSSESSDLVLVVRVDTNGQYRDQKSVKLNQIAAFDLPVPKVNALKIIVSLKETAECSGSGAVEAVLMNMVLS